LHDQQPGNSDQQVGSPAVCLLKFQVIHRLLVRSLAAPDLVNDHRQRYCRQFDVLEGRFPAQRKADKPIRRGQSVTHCQQDV
jgi:hypothetical protein